MRNGLDRETNFGTVWLSIGFDVKEPSLAFKLRQNAPWIFGGPLLALCWKTVMHTPIANPLQKYSTASNGFAIKVRPAVKLLSLRDPGIREMQISTASEGLEILS